MPLISGIHRTKPNYFAAYKRLNRLTSSSTVVHGAAEVDRSTAVDGAVVVEVDGVGVGIKVVALACDR